MRPLFYTLLCLLLLSAGCTIERQHFRNGWHVEWRKQHPRSERQASPVAVSDELRDAPAETAEPVASTEPNTIVPDAIPERDSIPIATIAAVSDPPSPEALPVTSRVTDRPEPVTIDSRVERLRSFAPGYRKERLPAHPQIMTLWGINGGILALSLLLIWVLISLVSPALATAILLTMLGLFILNLVLASRIRQEERTQPDYPYRKSHPLLIAFAGLLVVAFVATIVLMIVLLLVITADYS